MATINSIERLSPFKLNSRPPEPPRRYAPPLLCQGGEHSGYGPFPSFSRRGGPIRGRGGFALPVFFQLNRIKNRLKLLVMRKSLKTNAITAPEPSSPSPPPDLFPIVGIGASAGGLEALEQFFSGVPADSGMAFVIVQHLDPTHEGMMPELLQRGTPLAVQQVEEGMSVWPNHVYIIPPNRDLSLIHGTLHLFEPGAARGLRLPIDFFFRSLAENQRERSIGIILSGMGSDGTLGLRAIKEMAGVALVQDPATAKFDGMPRSAIDTGLADIVAPAEELCERLLAYLQMAPPHIPVLPVVDDLDQSGLDKVMILLRAQTGHDFSQYKKSTLYRRIERRMRLHQFDKIAHYLRYLQENPGERELLFKELLIGVTRFFRDADAWAQLRDVFIPQLLAERLAGGPLRAWAAGCSTGEEAYSLGIVFKEALEQLGTGHRFSLQIFATDLDPDAIAKARVGLYPANIAADVSPERLQRFFIREDSGSYRIGKAIRELVTFAPQNVIQDPPFTKLDVLICRNLLIYLNSELQHKLIALFHYSLSPGGILFLGSAETIANLNDQFSVLDSKSRLYRRETPAVRLEPALLPTMVLPMHASGRPGYPNILPIVNLQMLADQILLQRYAPAAVLVNSQGDILYISGRTGKYLEPAAGQANWNIFAMAREGLREPLLRGCQEAFQQPADEPIVQQGLRVRTNGDYQTIDLTVQALKEPDALHNLLMVVFTEVVTPAVKVRGKPVKATALEVKIEQLERETQRLREALQITHEEMQTTHEELKSANEELQSTNEELQSSNEELTTSKEEMQSLNEELQTVNAELQAKVEELSRANNDMKNLLNSTDIATIFLDEELRVRRFTTKAATLIKLIPSDVGRMVTDIASDLIYPGLAIDVAEVLRTLMFIEKPIHTRDERWFTARIMPYRTLDNRIDGVVLTLVEITDWKRLEGELLQVRQELNAQRADQAGGE
ncbi:MAG: two-component system, chemotaxis family, CheB/CheR fusion protein [Pseudomonadota bacterium]|nr:two-component system, chemotaxis family, CheB/CheR fusion protein [Pseudomonadota bacterium]